MTVTVAQFRSDFPEFSSTEKFPTPQVQWWLDFAYEMLDPGRWMNILDKGAELYAAHNLVLEAQAMAAAKSGGVPGLNTGPMNSKSVDKVSAGYDTGNSTMPDASHWNLTTYGTRFYRIMLMIGSGPVQIGVGVAPPSSGPAWPGPYVPPNPG